MRRSAQRPRHSLRLHVCLYVQEFAHMCTHVHTRVAPDTGAEAQRQMQLAAASSIAIAFIKQYRTGRARVILSQVASLGLPACALCQPSEPPSSTRGHTALARLDVMAGCGRCGRCINTLSSRPNGMTKLPEVRRRSPVSHQPPPGCHWLGLRTAQSAHQDQGSPGDPPVRSLTPCPSSPGE